MSKQKYIVTRKGVNRGLGDKKVEHEIGDTLELSESQAAGLVGKVKLKSEAAEPSKSVKALTAENAKLVKVNSEKLAEQATQLDALNKQTVEQANQIGKLTADLAAATKAK